VGKEVLQGFQSSLFLGFVWRSFDECHLAEISQHLSEMQRLHF
jgi:hypothetical protein